SVVQRGEACVDLQPQIGAVGGVLDPGVLAGDLGSLAHELAGGTLHVHGSGTQLGVVDVDVAHLRLPSLRSRNERAARAEAPESLPVTVTVGRSVDDG